jgi:phage tail sheath protein FI
MPEYLSPGVHVEETSFRGKPIEGVSTSTAGLVGRARTGREGRPTLVTSFTQFVREFGQPIYPPDPTAGDMLGHAVRGFFDNGGSRAWIVRVLGSGADASDSTASTNAGHGVVLGLPRNTTVLPGANPVRLASLRGVTGGAVLEFHSRPSATAAFSTVHTATVNSWDPILGTVTLNNAIPAGVTLDWRHTYVLVTGVAPHGGVVAGSVPVFEALDRGVAGDELRVALVPTDRPPVRLTDGVNPGDTVLTVATVGGFYTGALVEVENGSAKYQATVTDVDPTLRQITLDTAAPVGFTYIAPADPTTGAGFLRVLELAVEVRRGDTVLESFTNLSWNPDPLPDSFSRYYVERLNDPDTGSAYISVIAPVGPTANALADQPASIDGQPITLGGGDDGIAPTEIELIGADLGPGQRTGIQSLKDRDDVSMVAVPGVVSEAVQGALITHAELMKYRVAVLDGERDAADVPSIEAHRNAYDSSHAAYYTPWLETLDLNTGRTLLVPPSGHVMGIWARSDNQRGVHKAPANEVVRGITDVAVPFTTGEQDVLNPLGVNLVREFTGRGIRVWGARTLSSDPEWKYLNVRRLFAFIERSIDLGTQWVVFEPNNPALWARVTSTIEAFLFGVWKTGALMGTSPKEAYFVRCDRTTMTQDDLDNGRLVVLVGLAPTKPAEFVIFRIGQFTASNPAS